MKDKRKKYVYYLSVLVVGVLQCNVFSAVFTNGDPADNLWYRAANWDIGVPIAETTSIPCDSAGLVGPLIDSATTATTGTFLVGSGDGDASGITARLTVTGGTLTTGNVTIGRGVSDAGAGGDGIVDFNDATWNGSGFFIGGNYFASNGTLNIGSGTINMTALTCPRGNAANQFAIGQINMTGGTINISGNISLQGKGIINLNGGTIEQTSAYNEDSAFSLGDDQINITGGKLVFNGDARDQIEGLVNVAGVIKGYGASNKVYWDYDLTAAGKTTVWAKNTVRDDDYTETVLFSESFGKTAFDKSAWTDSTGNWTSEAILIPNSTTGYSITLPASTVSSSLTMTDGVDTTGAVKVLVTFLCRDDDLDSGDFSMSLNQSSTPDTFPVFKDLSSLTEDSWHAYTLVLTDPKYMFNGLKIRFDAVTASGEQVWIDNVTIVARYNYDPVDPVLVEAESFDQLGGWVVDQQFADQMGSPYLLAHGLGQPVADANTVVTFPSTGIYNVWVRTRNWVPGPWDAPGRFKLMIDGSVLDATFGTNTGWNWQNGGAVSISKTQVEIRLQDLTGFDGRCDAIYFDKNPASVPPNFNPDSPHINRQWRNTMRGLPAVPPDAGYFDVVIVGGGISGCAAALAAEQKGLKVALIHDRMALGGNASSEVRVHTIGIYGQGQDILEKLCTSTYPYCGHPDALLYESQREQAMSDARDITIFRPYRAYSVERDGSRIISVDAGSTTTGQALRFRSDVFIDCTGDGWIGYWAGAEYSYGRESKYQYDEGYEIYGDFWSPQVSDNRVMGASVLWYSSEMEFTSTFPEVPWAMDVALDKASVRGDWYWEYSSNDIHQVDDAEEIRDHLWRAIYGSFYNAKQNSNNDYRKLDWVAYILGKRESRRLIGDYVYKQSDIVNGTLFDDAVAEEIRKIDVHFQRNLPDNPKPPTQPYEFISQAVYREVPKYYIPFRCLYSKNIDNLMMAGRCFSCSHIALGGPRIMKTCGQMGIATGYAAALCKKYNTDPRGIYNDHIAELKSLISSDMKSLPLFPDYNDLKDITENWLQDNLVPWQEDGNLVGQWDFDDNTADDSSGNDRHGTLVGNAVIVNDLQKGKVLQLDGDGDYVQITGYKGIVGSASRTVCAWIKTTDDDAAIISWGNNSVGQKWELYIPAGLSLLRQIVYTGQVTGSTDVNDGQWRHVASVFRDDDTPDSEEIKLYVDGQEEIISDSVSKTIDTGSTYYVMIGTWINNNYFNGLIDDVRIYDYALSPEDIRQIYENGQLETTGEYFTCDEVPAGDINGDCLVNLMDFALLANNWLGDD